MSIRPRHHLEGPELQRGSTRRAHQHLCCTFPEGIKVTLLPKLSRGAAVHLTLTLRYGDAESLKGFEAASGFLGELMLHGT